MVLLNWVDQFRGWLEIDYLAVTFSRVAVAVSTTERETLVELEVNSKLPAVSKATVVRAGMYAWTTRVCEETTRSAKMTEETQRRSAIKMMVTRVLAVLVMISFSLYLIPLSVCYLYLEDTLPIAGSQ